VFVFLISALAFFNTHAQGLEPTDDLSLMEIVFEDFKGKPRTHSTILFEQTESKKIFAAKTDAKGKAQFLLPEGNFYLLRAIVFGDTVDYDILEIEAEPGAFSYGLKIKYEPPKEF